MKIKSVKIKALQNHNLLITFTNTKKKYWLFGKEIEFQKSYRGVYTVWFEYPSGKRCGLGTEEWLAEYDRSHRWSKEDELS